MSDETNSKMVVMCNHDDEHSVMGALVIAAAGAATGEEVFMFIQPGAAKMVVKGELEKFQNLKGQPDPIELFDAVQVLDGHIILCELGLPIHDIKEEDLRDGVVIMNASSFLFDVEGASLTFSY